MVRARGRPGSCTSAIPAGLLLRSWSRRRQGSGQSVLLADARIETTRQGRRKAAVGTGAQAIARRRDEHRVVRGEVEAEGGTGSESGRGALIHFIPAWRNPDTQAVGLCSLASLA